MNYDGTTFETILASRHTSVEKDKPPSLTHDWNA